MKTPSSATVTSLQQDMKASRFYTLYRVTVKTVLVDRRSERGKYTQPDPDLMALHSIALPLTQVRFALGSRGPV
jgi:hypothetical protein